MLKKYITYAKLNVFPRLHDADLDKLTQVYAELRRESSVSFLELINVLVKYFFHINWVLCIYSMDKEFQ